MTLLNLLHDPRDLALTFLGVMASLLTAAWIGYWVRGRPAALADTVERHERELRRLARLQMVDELTGLQNRRALEDVVLPAAVRNVIDTGKPLAVAFLDLDDFKQLNTRFGHDGADGVLKQVADRISLTLRTRRCTDQVFRRNRGDEFVLVLPGANLDLAGRILADVLDDLRRIGVSASIGCVVAHAGNLPSAAALLHQADEEMRVVKRAGKGQLRIRAAVATAEHLHPVLPVDHA